MDLLNKQGTGRPGNAARPPRVAVHRKTGKDSVVKAGVIVTSRVRVARELGQGIIVLALTGSTVGGFLGMIAIAAKVLGR